MNVTVQTDSDGYIESIETSANEGWAPPVTRMAVAGALKPLLWECLCKNGICGTKQQ